MAKKNIFIMGKLDTVNVEARPRLYEEFHLLGVLEREKGKAITLTIRGCGVIDAGWIADHLGQRVTLSLKVSDEDLTVSE